MVQVDLHLHTTHSDGRLTPTQLIDLVASRGLTVVAVTDHDSTEGLQEAFEAAGRYPGLTLIPGVELSTDVADGEVHVLAYYVDLDDPEFQEALARFRDARLDRGRRMVEKLADLGMPVSFDRVLELAQGGAVGRPHVARALLEEGHVSSTQEAFDKYLGRNGPAYAQRQKLTPEDAVELALGGGALPVLAHPGYAGDLESKLPSMKAAGLVGMEVYYAGYDDAQVRSLKALADRYGLIPCGGSDYHAMGHPDEIEPGTVGPPLSTAEGLAALKASGPGRPARTR